MTFVNRFVECIENRAKFRFREKGRLSIIWKRSWGLNNSSFNVLMSLISQQRVVFIFLSRFTVPPLTNQLQNQFWSLFALIPPIHFSTIFTNPESMSSIGILLNWLHYLFLFKNLERDFPRLCIVKNHESEIIWKSINYTEPLHVNKIFLFCLRIFLIQTNLHIFVSHRCQKKIMCFIFDCEGSPWRVAAANANNLETSHTHDYSDRNGKQHFECK